MSMAVFIQPDHLLEELLNFKKNDGLLDRILFFAERPRPQYAKTIRMAKAELKKKDPSLISKIIMAIFNAHYNIPTCYTFTCDAQTYYDAIVDEYADVVNRKYDSDPESGNYNFN